MEAIWLHAFDNALRVDPKEHPILMSEAPLNPKANREKMTEVMFETFESPAMYLANHAVLSLYSSARLTGAAVDSGDGASHVVPVYEGYALPHATMKYDVAGRDLTSYMQRLLAGSDSHSLPLTSAKEIKERLCRVAQDFELESCPEEFSSHLSYTLPDGKVVRIGSETLQCPEVMFRPSLLGQHTTTGGFHQIVVNSIMKCDKDIREELFANIHLSGGNTLFPGMADRMLKELTALPPPEMEAKMIVSEDPQNSAWIGGSILASMPVFQEIWVSMKEYDEDGPAVIHRKCF